MIVYVLFSLSVCEFLVSKLRFLLQKDNPPKLGMHRSKSKHELKLLEKIPENAEATVVLVGAPCYFTHISCYEADVPTLVGEPIVSIMVD